MSAGNTCSTCLFLVNISARVIFGELARSWSLHPTLSGCVQCQHPQQPHPSCSHQHQHSPPLFAASTASAGSPNWLMSGPSCPEAKAALNMLKACELEATASKESLHQIPAAVTPGGEQSCQGRAWEQICNKIIRHFLLSAWKLLQFNLNHLSYWNFANWQISISSVRHQLLSHTVSWNYRLVFQGM